MTLSYFSFASSFTPLTLDACGGPVLAGGVVGAPNFVTPATARGRHQMVLLCWGQHREVRRLQPSFLVFVSAKIPEDSVSE